MALTTINSDGVKDDSIVNADIKSDAAIALSKLASTPAVLSGSTNNTITTVTGANAIQGEANLTFDGNKLLLGGTTLSSSNERPLQVHSVDGPKIAIGRNDTSISDGNTIGGLEFYGNDANGTFVNTAAIIVNADGTHGDDDKPTRMQFYTTADDASSATEKLRITSAGFIGAGTTSPNHMLQLHRSDSNNSYTQYTNSTTGSASGDGVWLGMGGDEICYLWQNENNHMVLGTNNSERLRITSDGAVGIGTATPRGSSSYQGLEISGTSGGVVTFSVNDVEKWNIYGADAVGGIYDRVNTRYNLKWHSDGDVELPTGNLKVANGKGIDFSAWSNTGGTGTGNKHEILTAYEQGTFTPRLKPNDSETGMVSGVGVYVRVGHIVHMRFSFTNKDTTSLPDGKTIAIDQLPFTCDMDGQSGYHTTSKLMMQRINTRTEATFYTNDNTSILYGISASDGGTWAGWQSDDFNNHSSTYLNFSMSMLCD